MKLWTIQTEEAWQTLQTEKFLRANPELIEDHWQQAYNWMVVQMKQRLGSPPNSCSFPVWAWYQWSGQSRAKPDLRSRGHLERGERGVRLELEVEENQVLLSDFDLWHWVLNYWYLAESEKDEERFDAAVKRAGFSFPLPRPLPNDKLRSEVERSWQNIFDLGWSPNGTSKEEKHIQAVVWEVRIEQVKGVKKFTAR